MSITPRVVLCMDGLVLGEFALDHERVTVGRKVSNTIQIDDLAISGEHARITTILGDSFLEDLDSTNGTCVNGRPVTRCALADGDVVEVGKYRLKYFEQDRSPQTVAHGASRRVSQKRQETLHSAGSAPVPRRDGAAVVRVLDGPHAGRELPLIKARTMLGSPGGQIAAITRRQDGYCIVPVEGGRPQVNGVEIDSDCEPLGARAVIELGGVRMEFALRT